VRVIKCTVCDEPVSAADDGDPARCVCEHYDDRHPDTTLSEDGVWQALASSYDAAGS
jgi:hypothetical protein